MNKANKALTDLTQGKVWKQLVKYSAPLVLSSVLQAMYGIVDTSVDPDRDKPPAKRQFFRHFTPSKLEIK